MKVFQRDFIRGTLSHRFKNRHHVQLTLGEATRKNRSTINKSRRTIHTHDGHDASRHVLVASADGHKAVEPLTTNHRLNGVRNHLAGNERILHPFGAHRNAIGDRDGIENRCLSAGRIDTQSGFAGELIDVHIARRHHAPGGSHTDLRLREIALLVAHGIKHSATWRATQPIQQGGGKRTHLRIGFGWHNGKIR